jgi:hypothetical protein
MDYNGGVCSVEVEKYQTAWEYKIFYFVKNYSIQKRSK